MAAIRRLFKDPNCLALQELGWQLFQDYSKGHSQSEFISKSDFKAASTSILLGQLNWSIQEAINYTCMSRPNWGNSYSTVGFNHTVQLSRCPELYWPNSDKTAGDSPSRISPSTFHIYWPPFITCGLFSPIN
ncbi:hypothetical protein O181_062048 [Austropuccinia psidii MF-1]|uniref:Uncharacterized protein n=1 Tax=Austropuccinia psidii MF-1 TaxID=1389203 RepID=A0A9Q3EJ33_9BASI|nr:hypothetical protein [Austropuccinia psidii MF-1]